MTIREQLHNATGTATSLNRKLEELIAVPVFSIGHDARRSNAERSQPPWNAGVAHLILDLHIQIRELETFLRLGLDMEPLVRGASEANTALAFKSIVNLAESAQDCDIIECVRWINAWCLRAEALLGERSFPKHLPRNIGQPEPHCPYCKHSTLRFWVTEGAVRCVNPECFDGNSKRPVALMEYSPVSQKWGLAWQDGSTEWSE